MPVTSQNYRAAYTGDGASTAFPTGFYLLQAADVEVYVAGVLKTLGVDYTVAGVHDAFGGNATVNFVAAPANTLSVLIMRAPPITQAVSVANNSSMLQSFFNDVVDKLTMIVMRLSGRALMIQDTDLTDALRLPLSTARASNLLGFDAGGLPIAVTPASLILYAIPAPLGSITVSQFRQALNANNLIRSVNISDDMTDPARIQWETGVFIQPLMTDALYAYVKTSLAYSTAQMAALFTQGNGYVP